MRCVAWIKLLPNSDPPAKNFMEDEKTLDFADEAIWRKVRAEVRHSDTRMCWYYMIFYYFAML